jgi:hypothetical protein
MAAEPAVELRHGEGEDEVEEQLEPRGSSIAGAGLGLAVGIGLGYRGHVEVNLAAGFHPLGSR